MYNAKIIAVANQKGGVGKTTSSLNIAAGLATAGKKVLAIDLDPQGNLTTAMGLEPVELENTIADLIGALIRRDPIGREDIHECIRASENLHLLPANIMLSVIDVAIVTATAREYLVKKIINLIKHDFDYILIDCLPSLGMLTINALTASDAVVVPVKAQFLDSKGFILLKDTIELVQSETNPSLEIMGVFLTMFNEQLKLAKEIHSSLLYTCNESNIKLFDSKISTSTNVATAPSKGKSIYEYMPESKSAREYRCLVKEILDNE